MSPIQSANMRLVDSSQNSMRALPLTQERLKKAKQAFSTRCMDLTRAAGLLEMGCVPKAGDLVLARVSRIGQHKRIERVDGRRSHLFAGDEVVVCYGNRYAPDQFEALVPDGLQACELVAAGGIAAEVNCRHRSIAAATRLEPLGLLTDESGWVMNVQQGAKPRVSTETPLPPVIAVVGTSMNAGKTTSAARLIRGLVRAGKKVAAAKVTGTGAGGDYWMMQDAGAETVLDFTDAGFASTYCLDAKEIEGVFSRLVEQLAHTGAEAIVVEVADGLLQNETRSLISSELFQKTVSQLVFAASDAMGAVAGHHQLRQIGCEVTALSGSFTASPLAVREVQEQRLCPVLMKTELSDPQIAASLIDPDSPLEKAEDETAFSV